MSNASIHPLWGSLALDRASVTSLQDQIVGFFRDAILSGRMPGGRRVPSSRQLATEHGVSRSTAVEAYERLTAEGYLTPKAGSGLFVCHTLPEDYLLQISPKAEAAPLAVELPAGEIIATIDQRRHHLPLTPGMPAIDHFPWKEWARTTAQVLRERPIDLLHYGDPRGERPLRQAIAEYLGAARGIDCTADQIVVVSGSKQGLDMVARIVGAPRGEVWFEEPGHAVSREVLESVNLVPVSIPVDRRGMIVSEALARAPAARLALVAPSHQYPLGYTMSVDRRLELLQWAESTGGWIIEDDHDGEYRYSGKPLAPLHTLDRTGRVIYIGSFSNLLAPGLRMGYLVVPPLLAGAFLMMRASMVPIMIQLTVARFIASGRLSSHLRRMRGLHARRRAVLIEAVEREAAGLLRLGQSPQAGMRVVAHLLAPLDDTLIARRALDAGVYVQVLSTCYASEQPRSGLIMGFASTPDEEIAPAVRRLAGAIRACA